MQAAQLSRLFFLPEGLQNFGMGAIINSAKTNNIYFAKAKDISGVKTNNAN